MFKLLVVEDDRELNKAVCSYLNQNGYKAEGCLSLFSAAWFPRHPLSLSYGAILPSSLTMLLPPALGFSPHPPVSVYGTGTV